MKDVLVGGLVFVAGVLLGAAGAAAVDRFSSDGDYITHTITVAKPRHPQPFRDVMVYDAAPTVRKLLGDYGACSVVVVAPGFALTAQHCQSVGPIADAVVDGHSVAAVRTYSKKDVMLLSVPGLVCPCAQIGTAPAAQGEDVASIGYPMALDRAVAIGMSQGQTIADKQAYTMHTAYSGPGMSGGGLFVQRDGVPQLVAITSRGVEGVFVLSVDVSWMRAEHLRMEEKK